MPTAGYDGIHTRVDAVEHDSPLPMHNNGKECLHIQLSVQSFLGRMVRSAHHDTKGGSSNVLSLQTK